MKEQLEQLKTITNYLHLPAYSEKILRLEQELSGKEYLLTVMGPFSAGKSCLLNNLIGREILPVHITETTARITFIRYAEQDRVYLLHNDGSAEECSIEEVLKLWQSGEYSDKLSDIVQIDIHVNSEFLRNGLVIADTPGVNTIINKHIELTAEIIEAADRVLYVMGKSVTDTDLNFIRSILDSGVRIIFVRTHMDDLKRSEESVEEAIRKEYSILSNYTDEEIHFVSNEKSNFYYNEIDRLRQYVSENLAKNVEQELSVSISMKMRRIAQALKKELLERKQALDSILSDSEEEYLKRKKEIEESLDRMEKILQQNKYKLAEKYEKTKLEAVDGLKEAEEWTVKAAQKQIRTLEYGTASENYAYYVADILKNGFVNLQTNYLSYFDKMIKNNKEQLEEQLFDFSNYMQIDSEIPENLNEAGKQTQEIIEKLNALKILQDKLNEELINIQVSQDSTETERKNLCEEQEEIRAALADIQRELQEYPEYVTQYCEKQAATHENESVWRSAGKIADLATILIPAGAWAKVGAKLLNLGSKGAKVVKATKTAGHLTQAAQKLEKSTKALKAADFGVDALRIGANMRGRSKTKVNEKDIEKAVEGYQKARGTINDMREQDEENTSLLDYLTIEHYFAQIGKSFDQPQLLEVDREYEQAYFEGKKEIEQRMQAQAEAEYKKRMEILEITDKQEQLKLKHNILQKKRQAAESEERQLRQHLDTSSRNDKIKAIQVYYSNLAADKFAEFCSHLRGEVFTEIDQKVKDYMNNYDFSICTNINKKRIELEELEKSYNSLEKNEWIRESASCLEYIQYLDKMIMQN